MIGDLHYAVPSEAPERRDAFYSAVLARFFGCAADVHVALGDVTQTGTADEWGRVLGLLRAASAPPTFRLILGNHDTLAQSKAEVLKTVGQPRYAVEDWPRGRAIFLDTTKERSPRDWGGEVDAQQLAWLDALPAPGARLALVFGHHPFPHTTALSERPMMRIEEAAPLEAALARLGRTVVYVNGHNHSYSIARGSGWTYVQSASALCVPSFRTIDITEREVRVRTVMLPELDPLAAEVRADTPGYWSNPAALGGPSDHEVDIAVG